MYNAAERRKIKYNTDPEFRKKERERVINAKKKAEFREWERQYNREYYHRRRKAKVAAAYKTKNQNQSQSPPKKAAAKKDKSFDGLIEFDEVVDIDNSLVEELIEEDVPAQEIPAAAADEPMILYENAPAEAAEPGKERKIQSQAEMCAILDIQVLYRCKRCALVHFSLDEAIEHVTTKHPMGYLCGKCPIQCSSLPELMKHMNQAHPVKADSKSISKQASPENNNKQTKVIAVTRVRDASSAAAATPKGKANAQPATQSVLRRWCHTVSANTQAEPAKKPPSGEQAEAVKRKRGRPPKVPVESSGKAYVVDSIDLDDEDGEDEEGHEEVSPGGSKRMTRQSSRAQTRKLLEQTINEALEDYVDDGQEAVAAAETPLEIYNCSLCQVSFLSEKFYNDHLSKHAVIVVSGEWGGGRKVASCNPRLVSAPRARRVR